MSTTPRLLLISPSFHGYWQSIGDAFARRGYEVHTARYDAYDTTAEKVRLKATVQLPERLRLATDRQSSENRRLTDRVIAMMRDVQPDRVVIIKGDGYYRFWDALDDTPRILWLYDDLHRHDYTDDFLRSVGPVVDYARSETEVLQRRGVDVLRPQRLRPAPRRAHRAPLWRNRVHRLRLRQPPRDPPDSGGAGPARPRLGPRLLPLRDGPGPHLLLERLPVHHFSGGAAGARLPDPCRGQPRPWPSTASRTATPCARSRSPARMGGVQLVDRDDVDQFYEVGTGVAVWHDVDELIDLARRALRDTAWAKGMRAAGRRRTLAETPSTIASRRSTSYGKSDPPPQP